MALAVTLLALQACVMRGRDAGYALCRHPIHPRHVK
jgi:hypothetical protein